MKSSCCKSTFSQIFGALLLRLWVGARLFLAGLDKFRTEGRGEASNFDFSAANHASSVKKFMTPMVSDSFLSAYKVPAEIMEFASRFLGHVLLGVGALILLGMFRSLSLLAGGAILLMLGIGLATLPDDDAFVMMGFQVGLCAFALTMAKHDWISVDGLVEAIVRKKKKGASAEVSSND